MLNILRVLPYPSTSLLLFKISLSPGCCQENTPRRSDVALRRLGPPPGRLSHDVRQPDHGFTSLSAACLLHLKWIGSWYLSFLISESNEDTLSHQADGFVEYVHRSSHYSAKLLYFPGAFSPLSFLMFHNLTPATLNTCCLDVYLLCISQCLYCNNLLNNYCAPTHTDKSWHTSGELC